MKVQKISVRQYDSLIERGILTKYDRIELLNGEIVEKPRKTPKHCASTSLATKLFFQLSDSKVVVRSQNPIWLDEFSEPEPDIVLVEPPFSRYFEKHPTPADIFLILEVSDSTLIYDRTAKSAAYARAGIVQYLLLNVQEQTLEDYREPSADGYQSKQTLRDEQTFNLVAFPDVSLQAKDFLPLKKI